MMKTTPPKYMTGTHTTDTCVIHHITLPELGVAILNSSYFLVNKLL